MKSHESFDSKLLKFISFWLKLLIIGNNMKTFLRLFSVLFISLGLTLLFLAHPSPARADICSNATGNSADSACSDAARAAPVDQPSDKNTASGGINSDFALTCGDAKAQKIISTTGFISFFCDTAGNPPNSSIIEVVVQQAVNWLSLFGSFLFAIMIALAGIQITAAGASPEGLKAGKKRMTLAISSLALLWGGNVFLGLVGITGRQFLGVPLDDFKIDTFNQIIIAVLFYLQFVSGAMAVAFIMVGGVRMMTSAGNPQGIQAARKTITYALVGFAITIGLTLVNAIVKLVITGSY